MPPRKTIGEIQNGLDVLQRRFRDMESAHRSGGDESMASIRLQQQQIQQLKVQNLKLKEDLTLQTRQAKTAVSSSSKTSVLLPFNDDTGSYERKIDVERQRIGEIEEQISEMQKQILKQRDDMGGINANTETNHTIQKNIRMLENRLDKALVKYNEALGHNQKLRANIDNHRRERIVFEQIYTKLENELTGKQESMAKLMEGTNTAYAQRDSNQGRMMEVQDEAARWQKKFEKQWTDMTSRIKKNRGSDEMQQLEETRKLQEDEQKEAVRDEGELRQRLSKGAWEVVKDKGEIHNFQENVRAYEEAFERIRTQTSVGDIEKLVDYFHTSEEDNFRLFNQVNDLTFQIEQAVEANESIRRDIAQVKVRGAGSSDNQRKRILDDIQGQIEGAGTKSQFYEDLQQKQHETLDEIKDSIRDLLATVGADQGVTEIMRTSGITETNMRVFLGEVERKINDEIGIYLDAEQRIYAAEDQREGALALAETLDDEGVTGALLGVGIGATELDTLRIVPPSTLDDGELEDDTEQVSEGEEPFTHQQLHSQTMVELTAK